MKYICIWILFAVAQPQIIFAERNTLNCPEHKVFTISKTHYAAVNLDTFSKLKEAQSMDNKEKIEDLKNNNLVIQIPSGTRACIVNHSFFFYRVEIRVNDSQQTYWLDDSELTKTK